MILSALKSLAAKWLLAVTSVHPMKTMFYRFHSSLCGRVSGSRLALQPENIALRHQNYGYCKRNRKRLRLNSGDRFFWVWLSRIWTDWRFVVGERSDQRFCPRRCPSEQT